MPRRIPHVVASRALDKQLAGQSLTRREQLALTNLQNRLGLARSLADYAPRTRRRYLAAAREGLTARETNQRDYRSRPTSFTGPARRREIERLREAIYDSTVEQARDAHSVDAIEDLIDLYGEAFTLRVLADQHRAIQAYQSGDNTAGKRRWDNREQILAQYRSPDTLDASDTDVYFYYHGKLN